MRKFLAILMLIALGAALYYYFGTVMGPKPGATLIPVSEEKLMESVTADYDTYLKKMEPIRKLPDQLAQMNCMITRLLYSGTLNDEQMKIMFEFQREFYDQETLDNNPEDQNYMSLRANVKKLADYGLKIIGFKMAGSQYVTPVADEAPQMIFYVIYYLNINAEGSEVYKGYVYEENEDKSWSLKGFETVESFPTMQN